MKAGDLERLRILFVSNHFPPEVNAPATRTFEHARRWAASGHEVEVVTAVPNFPEGRVHPGYRNQLSRAEEAGVQVLRVPVLVARNQGVGRRSLSYLSFLFSAVLHGRKAQLRPDVVVATSPQLLAGLAGCWFARRSGVPFVLEVRDLWPDSIVAVGALPDAAVIRLLGRLERYLYRQADHVVVVTRSFRSALVNRGVSEDRITFLPNGVDWTDLPQPSVAERGALRRDLGLDEAFIVAWVGTLGLAHRVEVLVEAARRIPDEGVHFVIVGTGAEAERIEEAARDLPHVHLVGRRPREEALRLLHAADAAVVHLRRTPAFREVLPSKMFEAMAVGCPILLGVEGEAADLLETSGAGIAFEPENVDALLTELLRLKSEPALRQRLSAAGPPFVREHFDRCGIADRYASLLRRVANGPGAAPCAGQTSP